MQTLDGLCFLPYKFDRFYFSIFPRSHSFRRVIFAENREKPAASDFPAYNNNIRERRSEQQSSFSFPWLMANNIPISFLFLFSRAEEEKRERNLLTGGVSEEQPADFRKSICTTHTHTHVFPSSLKRIFSLLCFFLYVTKCRLRHQEKAVFSSFSLLPSSATRKKRNNIKVGIMRQRRRHCLPFVSPV